MIFAIYKRESDTCGNEGKILIGYTEFNTQAEAEKEVHTEAFGGYYAVKVIIEHPQDIHDRAKHTRVEWDC
jgi:hypothetical protein